MDVSVPSWYFMKMYMAEIVLFYFEYALDNDKTDNSCEPGNKYKYTN